MADITRIHGSPVTPVPDTAPAVLTSDNRGVPQTAVGAATSQSFGEILRARQGVASSAPTAPAVGPEVRFSAHAQTRLQSRRITLDNTHLERLQSAVQKAASKGARDSLVLMDDLAMVVSITNRTVVTVVDKENLKQNVFTNIDSAVFA